MTLAELLLIFRARYRIVLLLLAATLTATLVVSMLQPRLYKASTAVVVNYSGTDPVTRATVPAQMLPGYLPTQVDIVRSMSVALRVVDMLKLAEDRIVREQFKASQQGHNDIRDWLAASLLGNLEVSTSRESSVITIAFKSSDPARAAQMANAFAQAYQQVSIQLKVDPSRQTSAYFNQQIKGLRENFEAAQRRLSKYQQDNGIVNADENLDVENRRLNELSSQWVTAQAQLTEAVSRRSQMQSHGGSGAAPDVTNNPLIQNLRAGLARAEAKFADITQRLERNHPQYQAAQAEVEKLRSDLHQQIGSVAQSVSQSAAIQQSREAELRQAVAAQKTKVLSLNRARDELSILTKEVDTAQRAYENISQRFTQTNLEGQANLSDVAVLTMALAPRKPFSPNLPMNVAMAVVIGLLLGLGGALLMEFMDYRVRSADGLASAVGLPVLGVIHSSQRAIRHLPQTHHPEWETIGWHEQFTRQST